jgi:opacity protein-like surface antigen
MKNITRVFAIIVITGFAHFTQAQTARLSYDLFGNWATHDKDGDDNNALGIGAGVNYFFTENMGVGLDTYTDGIRLPYMLNGSFIYRFVPGGAINPYAFAGLGKQWDHASQWTGHLGGGAEYNWTTGMGVFLDGRLVLPADTDNYGLFRLGVRFGF